MEDTETAGKSAARVSWEEESGLIDFLKRVHGEITRFDKTFDLGVEPLYRPPAVIDGKKADLRDIGFVVIRRNALLTEREYCLYALLKDRALYGYIGVHSDGAVETLRELKPMEDFRTGTALLYDWMRELLRASCEKI